MYDKSRYSFLLGFARQLENALRDDDVELSDAVDTLGLLVAFLLERSGAGPGTIDIDDDDGIVDDDDDGNGPPLGNSLVRGSAVPESLPPSMDVARREVSCGTREDGRSSRARSQRRNAALLKGARRGKK